MTPAELQSLIEAVARGEIDAAIAWGPIAGYFAQHANAPLTVVPVQSDEPGMTFAIGIGVRKGDRAFAQTLERVLASERPAIDKILDAYAVPRV